MKPIFGGGKNNCLGASLASILELDYDNVPDLRAKDGGAQDELVRRFLRPFNMFVNLQYQKAVAPSWKGYYLMCGLVLYESEYFGHAAVGLNGAVVHDPAKNGPELRSYDDGTYRFGYLNMLPKYAPEPFYSLETFGNAVGASLFQ